MVPLHLDPQHQTEQDNLLSYDALGIYKHLKEWLFARTTPSSSKNAQILAIKYEYLWDDDTVQAIRNFLGIPSFKLPPYRPRGYQEGGLNPQEIKFKELYNLGTENRSMLCGL